MPFTYQWDETFDVGLDTGTPVDDSDYQLPFDFTGRIGRITFDMGETDTTPETVIRFLNEIQARVRDAERPAPGVTPASQPASVPQQRRN
ncbi:hypothetical protein [Dankookia sp. P2]|uniref:hypothetical protein n=1 Tax=Dankookia sp. P2 TaxID=3423955 RepID=UPI003D67B8E3